MRKDFGAKPYTYPQPVLMIATYGEDGKPDVMNAAWEESAMIRKFPSVSVKIIKQLKTS